MAVNGKVYDWEDITINLPHGVAFDIEAIEYGDELGVELVYGKGGKARGYGRGNYSGDAKATLLKEEFDRFVEWAKQNARSLYGLKPFPITVSYANEGERIKTDKLHGCKIRRVRENHQQGSQKLTVEIEMVITDHIERDGLPAYEDAR